MAGVGCHTLAAYPWIPQHVPEHPFPICCCAQPFLPPQHFASPSPIFGPSSPCRPSTDLQEGVELALVPHEVRQVADEAEPLLVGGLVVRVVRVDA